MRPALENTKERAKMGCIRFWGRRRQKRGMERRKENKAKNRTSHRGSHAARFERSTHPRVHYSLPRGAQAEQKPSPSAWSPPLPVAHCLVRTSSPRGKIRFIEPGVVVLKSNEKYFHYPGCLYCLAGTDLTNVFHAAPRQPYFRFILRLSVRPSRL